VAATVVTLETNSVHARGRSVSNGRASRLVSQPPRCFRYCDNTTTAKGGDNPLNTRAATG